MNIQEINKTQVKNLLECLTALSEYHNEVSTNFKGDYPSRSYEDTLSLFSENLERDMSRIAVVKSAEKVIGFCKIDILNNTGKLDYLVVLPNYRGKKYGRMLMDWAMEQFDKSNVKRIEVRVVDGNNAIYFYEKYGFQIKSHILCRKCN